MMARHTPGPWQFINMSPFTIGEGWSSSDKWYRVNADQDPDGKTVCEVIGREGTSTSGNARANAALISLAPEMLKALQEIVVYATRPRGEDGRTTFDIAYNVLQKHKNITESDKKNAI